MKAFITKIFTIAVLLLWTQSALGQKLMWSVDAGIRFDNREYNTDLEPSQTIFAAKVTPAIGVGWKGHSLMIGGNVVRDFGRSRFTGKDPLFYYAYQSHLFNVYAGLVPVSKARGEYPRAFMSDSLRFYYNTIDGVLFQYSGSRGYVEAGCDWVSVPTDNTREKFMLFSAGRFDYKMAYGGYALNVFHHAGSRRVTGVIDNILFYPYVGVELKTAVPLDRLDVRVGWLQAMQNDRKSGEGYRRPGGVQIETAVEKWGVGVHNTLYLGGNIMPFYDRSDETGQQYGRGLYFGEAFYRAENGLYDRLELYWEAVRKNGVNFRISSVHHFHGRCWSWQQVLALSVTLRPGMFRSR